MSQQTFFPQAYMSTLPNVQTQNGNVNLRFAGQPPSQVAENMDGMTNDGTTNLVQNMNDFQDLQVVAVNNSAEYSRVGQFTMVSKGGGNTFHGRAAYDLNNSYFNARSYFSPAKTPYKEHRATGNFSGPIVRNKLFFYAGYTLNRIPSASYYTRDVATLKMRSGDFSDFLTQAKPVVIKDPLTGQPFPNNIIPLNRISPVAQKIQNAYIPLPNRGVSNSTFEDFGFTHPYPTDLMKWDGITARADYVISSRNQLFGRFMNRLTPYILAGAFPDLGEWTIKRNSSSLVVSDTHTFSPRIVNSVQWGWSRDYILDGANIDGFQPLKANAAISTIGLQGVNPQNFSVMGFPTMSITGVQTLSQNVGGVNQNRNDQEVSNTTTWAVSKHVLKFGAALRYFHDNPQGIPSDTFGNFAFNGSLSGIGYSDFLLGLPFSSTRSNPITDRTQTGYELGLFLQDTYKITSRITLDVGLRWDYFRNSLFADGLQYNWDPISGKVIVPAAGIRRVSPLYPKSIDVLAGNPFPHPAKGNFRPRLGVAYRISDRFVVRGGYGQYSEALGNLYRANGGGPFQISETYFNTIANGSALLSFPDPFPSSLTLATVPSQNVIGYPRETEHGLIHQWNVSLEREFRWGLGGRLSYIGSRSRGLNYSLDINKPQPGIPAFSSSRRPFPQFVSTIYTQHDGNAKYDAMQVEIQKRSGAFTLDAHYTLSNSMSDFLDLENPYSHKFWNRDAYNARNRFVFNASYEIPVGKGRTYLAHAPRAVDTLVGGWRLQWISFFQSGQYFSPSFSGSDPSHTNTSGGVPDRIADGNLPRDQRSPNRWFDPSAFVIPPSGRFGNSGLNILEGPGLHLHHLTAMKTFALTERVHFTVETMVANLFNTPHFDFPAANISVPSSAGRVFQLRDAASGTTGGRELSGPRQVLFRFRLEF